MAAELTDDDLRAIAERHRAAAPGIRRAEEALRLAPTHYQDHHDIGRLLDLLRTTARVVFAREDLDHFTCEVCGGRGLCVPDCTAGLLNALREGA